MALPSLFLSKPCFSTNITPSRFSSVSPSTFGTVAAPPVGTLPQKHEVSDINRNPPTNVALGLGGLGLFLSFAGPALSAELPFLGSSLQLTEPANALSLPTWTVHVSSVLEWITAMALVWQYGEKSGYESWKGLSWGMVPLLGGAFCACTWHFFYNSESLDVLVALQAALTVMGNATMCIAAYRIYKSRQGSKTP